ncbi:DUF6573 family protein [Nocardia sp. NPDC055029]
MFENAAVIYGFTRAAAIRDGWLVDVTAAAQAEQLPHPTALSYRAWTESVAYNGEGDDYAARTTAVLVAAREAMRDWPEAAYRGEFAIERADAAEEPDRLTLTAHVGPDDQGAPVITITHPDDE